MIANDTHEFVNSARRPLGVLLGIVLGFLAFWFLLTKVPDAEAQSLSLFLLVLPAIFLAGARSRYLIHYVLLVWIIAPELRRVVDWMEGTYNTTSLISIAPQLVSLTLLFPMFTRPMRISAELKAGVVCFSIAYAYGGLLGLLKNGAAALYDLSNYLAPFLVVLYAASCPYNPKERDSWLRTIGIYSVIIGIYGWVQWYLLPDWDAFWMQHTVMHSVGVAIPMEFRPFSTLNSAVPFSALMATGFTTMLLDKRWRGPLGWLGVIIVAASLVLSMVRTSWIMAILIIFFYIWFTSGKQRVRLAVMGFISIALIIFVLPYTPIASKVLKRLDVEENVHNDRSSLNQRISTSISFLPRIFGDPLGSGLGSISVATYKFSKEAWSEAYTDTGYLQILLTFGPVGTISLFIGFWRIYRSIKQTGKEEPELDHHARLARASVMAFLFFFTSANVLPGFGALLVWITVGAAVPGRKKSLLAPVTVGVPVSRQITDTHPIPRRLSGETTI